MRIYIAGRLSQREELHLVRRDLWKLGHEVVSTWIDEGRDASDETNDVAIKYALRDISQISQADLLILDTTSPLNFDGGGGREFEAGFAFAQFQHKKLWRVGPRKNAFHALVDRGFENWEECIKELSHV